MNESTSLGLSLCLSLCLRLTTPQLSLYFKAP